MRQLWAALLVLLAMAAPAGATNCSSYPYTLSNGQVADANQVMADFNTILNCANNTLAPVGSPALTGTPTAPAPAVGDNSYTIPTTSFVQQVAGPARYEHLVITNGTPSTSQVSVTADGILVSSAIPASYVVRNVSQTALTSCSGSAGCLDAGTVATSTWYAVWEIVNPSGPTSGLLLSTSFTAPTLPGGYTLSALIGAVKTDGSGNLYQFIQSGDLWSYRLTGATNNAAPPFVVNGGAWSSSWVSFSLGSSVPGAAYIKSAILGITTSGSGSAIFVDANNGASISTYARLGNNYVSSVFVTGEMPINAGSLTLYYINGGTNTNLSYVAVFGFRLNI